MRPKTLGDAANEARQKWYADHGGKDTVQVAYERMRQALADAQAEVARLHDKRLRASERADEAEQRAAALEAALRDMLDAYTGQQSSGMQSGVAKVRARDAAIALTSPAPRPDDCSCGGAITAPGTTHMKQSCWTLRPA